jgi:purine nucleoside phosphorylase
MVSLSACGSFKAELAPGTFVLFDQFVDRTHVAGASSSAPAAWRMSRWRIRCRLGCSTAQVGTII